MDYPEKLPIAKEGEQFPYRDIDDMHRSEMVNMWFEVIKDYNPPRYLNYVLYRSRPTSGDSKVVHDNFVAGLRLCSTWDREATVEDKYAVLGYVSARSMEIATGLLPPWTTDITEEIQQMEREQRDPIAFGRAAINGMFTSYPTLAKQYERLYTHVTDTYDITDSQEKGYFQAGMALPYMMSITELLKGAAANRKVSGVIVGSAQQLESMNFNDIFSVEQEE